MHVEELLAVRSVFVGFANFASPSWRKSFRVFVLYVYVSLHLRCAASRRFVVNGIKGCG